MPKEGKIAHIFYLLSIENILNLDFDSHKPVVTLISSVAALVLLENEHGVYLWEGAPTEELKGSAKRLHDVCKRLAMETTLKYCESEYYNISFHILS